MKKNELLYDPYNIIITGVGGQGNVLASRVLGNMLSQKGFHITIGETFGASQRGGSVMSHLRASTSSCVSPQIPKGRGHMVVGLEPTEALRVVKDYGNPEIKVLSNTRPIHSIGVICGEQNYPQIEDLEKWTSELSKQAWFVDVTSPAMELGNAIFGNIIMIGALSGTGDLPIDRDDFESAITQLMKPDKIEVNLRAFDIGKEMVEI